jgi:hypothetical protein
MSPASGTSATAIVTKAIGQAIARIGAGDGGILHRVIAAGT